MNTGTIKKLIILMAVAGGLARETAAAEDKNSSLHGFAAAGIAAAPEFEGARDHKISPLIAAQLRYSHYYIATMGSAVGVNLSPYPAVDFGPVLSYCSGRDDDVESNAVRRMRKIDPAVEAGMFMKLPFHAVLNSKDTLSVETKILADVSDAYAGYRITLGASYNYPITEKLSLNTAIQIAFASDNYNQTYFGVDADNATRSGLPAYDASSGWKDIGLTFTANYKFNAHWSLMGITGYKRMLETAADSPIIEQEGDENQWIAGLGISFRF